METNLLPARPDTKPIFFELGRREFEQIRELTYRVSGIQLPPGKELLVKSRLSKRLKMLGIPSFKEYLALVQSDKSGQELAAMIELLTTNKTDFFREPQHFDYLRKHILSRFPEEKKKLRIWSAGCSTGEEPYTIAIVLTEALDEIGSVDMRILATDISTKVLGIAREGIYSRENLAGVPPELRHKYFVRTVGPTGGECYRVHDKLKSLVKFARLNLMSDWPMKGPFDVIFCRNVMIYFDKQTQRMLIKRFANLLESGGYLFTGHSESLMGMVDSLRYIQPAIYQKK